MVFRYLYPALAYDFDVMAFRASVQGYGGTVSDARMAIINTFVTAEKTSGAWGLTDDYWGLWAESSTQALTSLKQRRLSTVVNAPTFTVDRDYVFNGTTNYINTGFIPSTHGVNYIGTAQRLAIYARADLSASGTAAGCRVGSSASISIVPRNGSNMTGATNNSAGTVSFALSPADSRGYKSISRAGGGTTALGYDRGVRLTDATGLTVGTNAPAVALTLGCLNSNSVFTSFRAASLGLAAIGGPLSDAQETAQYNAVQAWATSVGANV